jgi:hypothetical protein
MTLPGIVCFSSAPAVQAQTLSVLIHATHGIRDALFCFAGAYIVPTMRLQIPPFLKGAGGFKFSARFLQYAKHAVSFLHV